MALLSKPNVAAYIETAQMSPAFSQKMNLCWRDDMKQKRVSYKKKYYICGRFYQYYRSSTFRKLLQLGHYKKSLTS